MATVTLATNATLTAVVYTASIPAADYAAMHNILKDDDVQTAAAIDIGAFSRNGLLYVPNRGVLQIQPGDYIGIDSKGWPILVSALSAGTAAAWTHT